MSKLNDLFMSKKENKQENNSSKYNELQLNKMRKLTENGDDAFNSTGNNLLDIFFMSEYFQKNLSELKLGNTEKEKIFSMFMRDPRFGMGRRDIGRELMSLSEVSAENALKAGRADDLLYLATDEAIDLLFKEATDNKLVKKWLPRLTGKDSVAAKYLAKRWFGKPNQNPGVAYKKYRQLIKTETVENLMSHHRDDEIVFEHVPSLAMIKYFKAFSKKQPERFEEYLKAVKSGEKKLNVGTTNVYDIYKNREELDAQLFFDKLEKIKISCIPIIDSSGSMEDENDSYGKAMAIGHYLSKCSTYCPNQVISFSSKPQLITMGQTRRVTGEKYYFRESDFIKNYNVSDYINEINSLHTGDCSNTDFGAVISLLGKLDVDYPDYFVVLSDMEFDSGSSSDKKSAMKEFKKKGIKTKIVWFNFNSRNKTAPELDEHGNIFISGYNPMMLKYLEAGFDGEKFLDKLLHEYKNNLNI